MASDENRKALDLLGRISEKLEQLEEGQKLAVRIGQLEQWEGDTSDDHLDLPKLSIQTSGRIQAALRGCNLEVEDEFQPRPRPEKYGFIVTVAPIKGDPRDIFLNRTS